MQNRSTEKSGLSILLRDPRFQMVDTATKRRIIESIGVTATFGIQTFDLVMTPEPRPPITLATLESLFQELTMVEMKVTKKPIKNEALNGFFFGATERERAMATALGEKYRFAFVVLTDENEYGRPFAVLLTLDELERRTRPWRVQYQVELQDRPRRGRCRVLGPARDPRIGIRPGRRGSSSPHPTTRLASEAIAYAFSPLNR